MNPMPFLIGLLLACAPLATAAPGLVARGNGPPALPAWPDSVENAKVPEVAVVTEDRDANRFVYRTEHFEFTCDVRLGAATMREFGQLFEATWLLNCRLPLNLSPNFEPGRERFAARLFEKDEDYRAAGGPVGTAGYYSTGARTLMVPLSSLGVKVVGQRVLVDYKNRNHGPLVHEITHQMMNRWLPHLPVWYAEGSACYTELPEYSHGRFSFASMRRLLREAAGRETTMLAPEKLMAMTHQSWATAINGAGAPVNYRSASLLTVYFYHADDDGKATRIMAYLKAIDAGTPEPAAAAEHLLRGRTAEKFRNDVREGLVRMGIKVAFQ